MQHFSSLRQGIKQIKVRQKESEAIGCVMAYQIEAMAFHIILDSTEAT